MTVEHVDFSGLAARPARRPVDAASVIMLPVVRREPCDEPLRSPGTAFNADPLTGPWMFTLAVNSPKAAGHENSLELAAFDDTDTLTPAARYRLYADALESCARVMRATAEKLEPSPDGRVLAMLRIYTGGRLTLWTHLALERMGQPGAEWLGRRLTEAGALFNEDKIAIEAAPPPAPPPGQEPKP